MTDAQLMKSTRKALGLTQTEMAKKNWGMHTSRVYPT
jgi:predicted transcriptional regulator